MHSDDGCGPRSKAIQTVSISFFRFDTLTSRLWAFAQMGLARSALRAIPDIGFCKLFGTGTGEGFTPLPNTAVYAILGTWPSAALAKTRVAEARLFQRYKRHAYEHWTVFLQTQSVRGNWDKREPFECAIASNASETPINNRTPIAALTRASIKPRIMHRFWGRVPNISRMIGADPHVAFKMGMGELPWLRQVTFSIWPDTRSMAEFARVSGPHADAIKAVREGQWFSEELYARFSVCGQAGSWQGRNPLQAYDISESI